MKKRVNILLLSFTILLAGVFFVMTRPVSAQDGKPTPSDNDVNRVARQMFCPVCENIPLDVCPTQACKEWRELIRQKLSDGWTDQQIKDYFAQQYGDRVLAEPPRRGLNWLVYLLPPIFIVVGGVFVWRVLKSMSKKRPVVSASDLPAKPLSADDPYLARLEDELKKKD